MRLGLDADRLLPVDPATRAVARRLYDAVAAAPILSPHGHRVAIGTAIVPVACGKGL
ncbi:MAG: hypothetical protein ABIS08_00470 [Pseudolysinimonas sp.]